MACPVEEENLAATSVVNMVVMRDVTLVATKVATSMRPHVRVAPVYGGTAT